MIKIVAIMFFCLLAVSFQAESNQWYPLKYVEDYGPKDFNLKNNVAYLEIRQYQVNDRNKLKKRSYKTILSLYRAPLKSFNPSQIKKFHNLAPDLSDRGNIRKSTLENQGVGCHYRYNGFLIDNNGKMYRMNTIEEVIGLLGNIDTAAEAQTVLWLYDKVSGNSYCKSSRGYDILMEYQDTEGDAQTEYCKKYQYQASINEKGNIVKYKLLKTIKTKTPCMHIDWLPCN